MKAQVRSSAMRANTAKAQLILGATCFALSVPRANSGYGKRPWARLRSGHEDSSFARTGGFSKGGDSRAGHRYTPLAFADQSLKSLWFSTSFFKVFRRILEVFWSHFGAKNRLKNGLKNGLIFSLIFLWFWGGFWMDFRRVSGLKINKKTGKT